MQGGMTGNFVDNFFGQFYQMQCNVIRNIPSLSCMMGGLHRIILANAAHPLVAYAISA